MPSEQWQLQSQLDPEELPPPDELPLPPAGCGGSTLTGRESGELLATFPSESCSVYTMENEPLAVGSPERVPVDGSKVTPGGNPVTENVYGGVPPSTKGSKPKFPSSPNVGNVMVPRTKGTVPDAFNVP